MTHPEAATNTQLLVALVAVGGIVVGALLNWLFGLFTGWVGRRHEHRSWLREKRLQAYADFIAAMNDWTLAYARAGHVKDELNDQMRTLINAGQSVRILGPEALSRKLLDITDVVFDVMRHYEPEGTDSFTANRGRIEQMQAAQFEFVALAQKLIQGRNAK